MFIKVEEQILVRQKTEYNKILPKVNLLSRGLEG